MATYKDTIITYWTALIPTLVNNSVSAVYKLLAQGIGQALDNTIVELQNTEATIDDIITNQRYGRFGYYIEKALAFQYDENNPQTLTVDPVTLDSVYATVDTSLQIVKQVAFKVETVQGAQRLTMKIAVQDSQTLELRAATTNEKNAFDSYFVNYEIPGIPVTIVSFSPNELDFNATIRYYSTTDFPTLKADITQALIDFRTSYVFNGTFYINDLESYLKTNVNGVRNVYLSNVTLDSVAITDSSDLSAGYFAYSATILDQLTYVTV